ncbi:hypothetical protein [Ruegeria jejuensis]|uniref:hypothetical protein n=1 Tax=Ruegeria jejuensis TaxID=3233338 RepID=UPI00355C6CAA
MLPAKAISAAFCRLGSLPERVIRSGKTLFLACLVCTGTVASAQPSEESEKALLEALDLCASGFGSLDSARDALTNAGWTEFENGPASVMVSSILAFSIDETDLAYTVENAYFMAASILGNSALGPNQLAFVHSDILLGLIGVEEGSQYCVVGGPKWTALTALQNGYGGGVRARTKLVSLLFGRKDQSTTAVALLDLDAFFQELGSTETDSSKKKLFGAPLKELLMPANITVAPDSKDENEEAK